MYITIKINFLSQQILNTFKGWQVNNFLFTHKVLFFNTRNNKTRGRFIEGLAIFSSILAAFVHVACCLHVVLQNENVAQEIFKKTLLINRLQHSITNYCQLSSSIGLVWLVTYSPHRHRKYLSLLLREWLNYNLLCEFHESIKLLSGKFLKLENV